MNKLVKMLNLIPLIWAGIEHLHADKDHATKKQLALDALGFSASVAASVDPQQTAAITAAQSLAATTIDGVANFWQATKNPAPITVPPVVAPLPDEQ